MTITPGTKICTLASGMKEGADRIVFSWTGGPYIEIHFDYVSSVPFDVINVWDYATDSSTVPFTQADMQQTCRDWLGENRDELPNHYLNHVVYGGYR